MAEIDGGVEDIRPEQFGFGAAQPETPTAFAFQIGDQVSPPDRDNLGEVIAVEATRVQVRLVNKHSGNTAELFFPPGVLQLVRRSEPARELAPLTLEQLLALDPGRWLVNEVLRLGELAVLYAPPGTYKTFIALSMALSVALGIPWAIHETIEGAVLYIAGEGLYSIRERTKAWMQQFPDQEGVRARLQENFFVLGDVVSFLEPDFELLLGLVKGFKRGFKLIVVDTLARCMAGGDENSAEDMGLFVHACDRLRKATGSSVLLVHHTGKADAQSERGSSALRGAADAMYLVTGSDDESRVVRLECSKQKEGEPFAPIHFKLDIVEVGIGDYGLPRTSGRLVQIAAPKEESVRGKPAAMDAAEAIQLALAEGFFENGAPGTALQEASQVQRAKFYRRLKKLVEDGIVEKFPERGHFRYRLTPKSKHYRPPVSVSVSPVSGSLIETGDPSLSLSLTTPLKGGERDETGTGTPVASTEGGKPGA
jgi:hypothetical protein